MTPIHDCFKKYDETLAASNTRSFAFDNGDLHHTPSFTAALLDGDFSVQFLTLAKFTAFETAVKTAYAAADNQIVLTNPYSNTVTTWKWNWIYTVEKQMVGGGETYTMVNFKGTRVG